jgi:flagellar hook-length control protein FliK
MSVDRVETLALLQRDAKTLERAFDQAGLKLADGSVDLSLRDQNAQGQGRHEHAGDERRDGSRRPAPDIRHEHADPALAEAPRRLWRGAAGIDVRI